MSRYTTEPGHERGTRLLCDGVMVAMVGKDTPGDTFAALSGRDLAERIARLLNDEEARHA